MNSKHFLSIFFSFFYCITINAHPSAQLLPSTEADLDSYIVHCVNVINGDYCESVTDLQTTTGLQPLSLQRTYNTKNYMTGETAGGWRIFPHLFLVLGQDKENSHLSAIDGRSFDRTLAFAGEPSGTILTYSGWRKQNGLTQDPLKINLLTDGIGIVNTHTKDISGTTNLQNNVLHCKGEICEVILGDGTRRIYRKVDALPSLLLGEELNSVLASQVRAPEYFHLTQEILPSSDQLLYAYNPSGHLSSIEITDASQSQVLAWMRFYLEKTSHGYHLKATTPDKNEVEYDLTPFKLANGSTTYALTQVKGYSLTSCLLDYQVKGNLCLLVKKVFADGRVVEMDYDELGKVKAIKEPHSLPEKPIESYSFTYGNGYTDVLDASGMNSHYEFDARLQLVGIVKSDQQGQFYSIEQKSWGETQADIGRLLAKSQADGKGVISSYHAFRYDSAGNVVEERTYKGVEEQVKTFTYSQDGFNLPLSVVDQLGNQTLYFYKPGTNLPLKERVYDKGKLKNDSFPLTTRNQDKITILLLGIKLF